MNDNAPEPANTTEELLGRIGHLTRQLREGLRELGLDKQVAKAAQAFAQLAREVADAAQQFLGGVVGGVCRARGVLAHALASFSKILVIFSSSVAAVKGFTT